MQVSQDPVLVSVAGPSPATTVVTNAGPSTVYYVASQAAARALNVANSGTGADGSVASGSSVTLSTSTWFICLKLGAATLDVRQVVSSTGGHTIQDEGVALSSQAALDFQGAGVTATDGSGKTIVTIPGSSAVTKRVTQPIHQPASTLQTTNYFDIVTRNLFMLPFTTARWRLRFRNCSQNGVVAAPSNAITIVGMAIGRAVFPASGLRWDGNMSGVVSALTNLAVPAGGAEFTSDWVTDSTAQFQAGTMHAVSLGTLAAAGTGAYNGGPGITIRSTGGGAASNQWNAAAALTFDNVVTFLSVNESVYDVRVEYEIASTIGAQVGLVVGDSLSIGVVDVTETDTIGIAQTHGAWPGQVMQRSGGRVAIVNVAIGGSLASDWQLQTFPWWIQRVDVTTTVPDFAIVFLGSNDINNNADGPTTIGRLAGVFSWIRGLGIQRVYTCTVPPRGFVAPKETNRTNLNATIGEQTLGSSGVFDFDYVLRSAANFANQSAEVASGGTIHYNSLGQARMASIARPG